MDGSGIELEDGYYFGYGWGGDEDVKVRKYVKKDVYGFM